MGIPNDNTNEKDAVRPPANKPVASDRQQRLSYTANETAAMLGISRKEVYRLCQRGLLKRSTALRTLLIPKWSIEQFLRDHSQ